MTEGASRPTGFEQAWSSSEPAPNDNREAGCDLAIIYIACSPFSGSTLLSFLLNTHPDVTTAGHTTGWAGLTPDFPCSCGATVEACPFFRRIRTAFDNAGLSFPLMGLFPTAYSLGTMFPRLDQFAFENLPKLGKGRLELWRDTLVRRTPWLKGQLVAANCANRVFVEAAMEYARARVYVDNSHSPYRCRLLAQVSGFRVVPVHLVRDVRGVVLSATEIYGWSADFAALHWVRVQEQILRVLQSRGELLPSGVSYLNAVVTYEEMCDAPETTLTRVTDRLSLPQPRRIDDFKAVEHHILGNEMRFGSGRIRKSQRWRHELSNSAQRRIKDRCWRYAKLSKQSPELGALLDRMFAK